MSVRHAAAGALAALAAFVVAGRARAQPVGTDIATHVPAPVESPQHFALEARFGAFWPAIDSDPALQGSPYGGVFGTGPQVLGGAELDWQVVRIPHLGTLGPGLGFGYMRTSTKAKFEKPQPDGTTISGEDTSLEIIPFYGVAVLRVDTFWRDYGIPLVPWAKLGLGLAFWRASNTLGTSSFNNVTGEGHSLGAHLALGLGLNLNVFDPTAAKEFDNSMGVNGTYLFAEFTFEDLSGLGMQSDPMRVGGEAWTFGLALEF